MTRGWKMPVIRIPIRTLKKSLLHRYQPPLTLKTIIKNNQLLRQFTQLKATPRNRNNKIKRNRLIEITKRNKV